MNKYLLLFILLSVYFKLSSQENNIMMAVGSATGSEEIENLNGAIISVSKNGGDTWHEKFFLRGDMNKDYTLRGITYGRGTFVAVGGDNIIVISEDAGEMWTTIDDLPKIYGPLCDVAYGKGVFVVVGMDRTVLVSTDAKEWKKWPRLEKRQTSNKKKLAINKNQPTTNTRKDVNGVDFGYGKNNHLRGIEYMHGRFYILGNKYRIAIMEVDGETIKMKSDMLLDKDPTIYLEDIAFGNNTFIATGSEGANVYAKSSNEPFKNKNSWKIITGGKYGLSKFANKITYSNRFNKFFTSYDFSYGERIYYTDDAKNWRRICLDNDCFSENGGLTDIEFADGRFVAVGNLGKIYISDDGKNWITRMENSLIGKKIPVITELKAEVKKQNKNSDNYNPLKKLENPDPIQKIDKSKNSDFTDINKKINYKSVISINLSKF